MRRLALGWVCDTCTPLKRPPTVPARRRSKEGNETPQSVRLVVGERDGHRCRWCLGVNALAVHHIAYRSEGVDHRSQNLVLLCQVCHMRAHSDKKRWKPVLLEVVRLTEAGIFLTVPEVELRMGAA